jgi:uncharacterized protein (DUF952 family)
MGVTSHPLGRFSARWRIPFAGRIDYRWGGGAGRHLLAMGRQGRAPMALIYKIHPASDWAEAEKAGSFAGAPVDLADGYIHFSTATQVRETAARHFAGREGLVLIAVEAEALGAALRWEPSRGGALFPHLYGPLRLADVAWSAPLPLKDGAHDFPAAMN